MVIDDEMLPARLSVTIEPYDACGVFVVVEGRLDSASGRSVAEAISTEIDRGYRHLIIDLDAVTFIDGAGVRSLAWAVAALGDDPDAAVVLAGGGRQIQRDLVRTDVRGLFPVAAGRWAALGMVRAPPDPISSGWRRASRPSSRPGVMPTTTP